MPNPYPTAWRTEVRIAVQRLREELELLSPTTRGSPRAKVVEGALGRATEAVEQAPSVATWWSGDQVERAWRAVKDTQANLVWLADDEPTSTRVANALLSSRGQRAAPPLGLSGMKRDERYRVIVSRQNDSDQYFVSVRQLRNVLWFTTALLTSSFALP